jgi:hypothetical protein
MKTSLLIRLLILSATVAALPHAQAEEATGEIKFSDPSKPGTLKIYLTRGELRVRGGDSPTVTIKSDAKSPRSNTRKDGLRELAPSSSYNLTEKDNVITLDASGDLARSSSYFNVTVPRSTSLMVSSTLVGEINCIDVNGDLEIKNTNGRIKLEGVMGSALVETTNGEVSADVRALHEGKPLSFTSMNGGIVIRVPADANANVRLRTQNGAILTDFDEKALVTKAESAGRSLPKIKQSLENADSDLSGEIQSVVREAVKVGMEATREAILVARDAAAAARDSIQESRGNSDGSPRTPRPPRTPLPPMTGGKIVTGTLNRGGPEIQAATLNGEVKLLKLPTR